MSDGFYIEVVTKSKAHKRQFVNVKSGDIESILADDYCLESDPNNASLFAARHIAYLDLLRRHFSKSFTLQNVRFVKAERYE